MVGLQPTAWPSGPGIIEEQEPAVGLEPTSSALRRRCPACRASPASREQPVLVSSQLDRGSKPQSPPEGLARRRSRASGGTRTRMRPFTGGVLVPSSCTGTRGWPAGVEPAQPGSQPGLAAAWSSATVLQPGIEPGTRPSQSRVMSLSPSKQRTVPRPGIEPGPAPSEGTLMSLSPPGQQPASDQGGT